MKDIYLSLGSNIGERDQNIARAIESLPSHGVRLVKQSALYETEPVELRAQDWFLNCIANIETNLSPLELMEVLLKIERSMARERLIPKGPRIIDVDIVLYGAEIVTEPHLEVPHPRMADRRFVLAPFAEIAPEMIHPILQKTIRQLLHETSDHSEVRRI
jgi:2-amino-4-hydroxy-6-hydroxymethyldihydropteridine diphosphokinase